MMTRRKVIAATVAAPLAPIAAQAGQKDDPTLARYEEWVAAYERYCACFDTHPEDGDPVMIAANEADHAAALRLAHTVPTTLAGVAVLIKFLPYVYGEMKGDADDVRDLESFAFNDWADDRAEALARSLREGVQRLIDAA